MSRPIKFRAWDAANSRMEYDQFYVHQKTGLCHYFGDSIGVGSNPEFYDCGEEEPVLMQFTGLKDKNGKEIYEGDIGEIKTQSGKIERFVVKWGIHRREMKSGWTVDIPAFCFEIDGFPSFPIANNYLNGHDLDIIEVIGNIYQNPDLIPAQ